MVKKGIFLIVGILLMFFVFSSSFVKGDSEFSVGYSDASGDVEVSGDNPPDGLVEAADIIAVSSMPSGSDVVFILETSGDIILSSGDNGDYSYFIYIDTDGDGVEDFHIVASSMYDNSAMMSDASGTSTNMIYSISVDGGTLTISVPQEYFGSPSYWDIYASTMHTWYANYTVSAKDWAPMEGFSQYGDDGGYTPHDGESTDSHDDTVGDTATTYSEPCKKDTSTYPGDEIATDTSVVVKIVDVKYYIKDLGNNKTSYDVTIKGTTSGVDHCWIVFVNHYDDGSKDSYYHWSGGFNDDDNEYLKGAGYEVMHFIPTSPAWKTWEYRTKGTINNEYVETHEGKKVVRVEIFVRGFSDAGNTKWSQDSYSVSTSDAAGSNRNGNSVNVSTPGFTLEIPIITFALVGFVATVMRKRSG